MVNIDKSDDGSDGDVAENGHTSSIGVAVTVSVVGGDVGSADSSTGDGGGAVGAGFSCMWFTAQKIR
ncbi:Hypothetical predicted protein [Octopus vulgaris]|uniref:Uncharacterized protein n=1 Tax=Octopus vulgaris TaxID=6645 RepID=A0AA36B4G2_OCTVU|nr:Hypothetical predicted protein [Octopus vulgaris]